ncbi:PREDICTED: charged multivesicular body protein 2a [Nipponia nippon]|uniref:charged multivesicular body protein 2a n=1 Tax=Nipponia nippon TaxID=128390 RepID=UPI000510813B|nr:PREDICTED: charged multivesicular body protein 2a [Nipponia nippon]
MEGLSRDTVPHPQVGQGYPHDPPKVKCETMVYHPNIDLEGNVCLNILREDWKPVLTINSIIYGLQYLFLDAVKIMAKDLVRTRRYVKKFITMRANVQAVSLKIQTLKSNNSMAQAMKGVTKAMATMNRQLKLPQIQKIMMEFEKQAEIMDMKEELMNDAIDDAMGDEDDEEESCPTVTSDPVRPPLTALTPVVTFDLGQQQPPAPYPCVTCDLLVTRAPMADL